MTIITFHNVDIEIHQLGPDFWADGFHVLSALYGGYDEQRVEWAQRMLPSKAVIWVSFQQGDVVQKRMLISLWGVVTLAIKSTATRAVKFAEFWQNYMEDTLRAAHHQRDMMVEIMAIKRRLDRVDAAEALVQEGSALSPDSGVMRPERPAKKRLFGWLAA